MTPVLSLAFRHVVRTALIAIGLSVCSLGRCQETGRFAARLVLLDGTTREVKSITIENGKVSGEGEPSDLVLDDLERIEVPAVAASEPDDSGPLVELRSGRIHARSVTIADEKCRLNWVGGTSLELPLDAVRAIRFSDMLGGEFQKAVAAPSVEHDRVLIRDESGGQTLISGLVEALGPEQLKLEVGGHVRSVAVANVLGIVVAQPAAADPLQPVTVQFADGSVLQGHSLGLADGKGELGLIGNDRVEFDWSKVNRVAIRSRRVAFLSDLKAVQESQQPLVTAELPAQRDRSASNGPLVVGSQSYEKGLGVHAYSEITFEAGGRWDLLTATIGLDPKEGEKGDCIFKILGDGEPLFSQRLRAMDAPRDVRVAVSGRMQVTLVVEPGEGLDLGDHANWCNARFVKNKP